MTYKKIKLSQGKFALVDAQFFPLLNSRNWYALKIGNTFYARRDAWISGKYTKIYMHRMIMGFPKGMIDHINRDGLDNRTSNLRLADYSKNAQNSISKKKYRGIYEYPNKNRWSACIKVKGKSKMRGYYKTPEEAALRYNELATKYFGLNARINKIDLGGE